MKTVLITVCGRSRFLSVQLPYILELKKLGLIDEHQLWLNTQKKEDVDFINKIANIDRNYFNLIENDSYDSKNFDSDGAPILSCVGHTLNSFYKRCTDLDSIYVKMDDDICFIETESFYKYIEFRKKHEEFFLVFPIIVNNCMDYRIFPKSHPFCKSGYEEEKMWRHRGGQIGLHLHNVFFDSYPHNLSRLKLPHVTTGEYACINCVSWLGKEFAKFNGDVGKIKDGFIKDEWWLIDTYPKKAKKVNAIFGETIVCHYAYGHQRVESWEHEGVIYQGGLNLDKTDVLEKYREISRKI